MGSILSSQEIDLSHHVLPSLVSFTLIPPLKYKQVLDVLISQDSKLSPTAVNTMLQPHFQNPKALIDAFTVISSTQGGYYVDTKNLLVALCFYSNSILQAKARNIFKLFLAPNSHTLKLPELTKLIKSLIVSVYVMTDQDIPEDTNCYRIIAQEVMGLMDMLNIKRVNLEEFVNSIKRDEIFLAMISKSRHNISMNECSLPTISRNKTVIYTQPILKYRSARLSVPSPVSSLLSPPSQSNSYHNSSLILPPSPSHSSRSRSLLPPSPSHSIKFPNLSPSNINHIYAPNERVVYQAYSDLKSSYNKVTEKGILYSDLANYFNNKCFQKPLYMGRSDWSSQEISLEEAIDTFKSYYDYLNGTRPSALLKKKTLKEEELEAYAKVYEVGDVDQKGWDKSDVFDVIGKSSAKNAYYLIEKHRIKRNKRLQFNDFLRSCLPEDRKFDDDRVNSYYTAKFRRGSSLPCE